MRKIIGTCQVCNKEYYFSYKDGICNDCYTKQCLHQNIKKQYDDKLACPNCHYEFTQSEAIEILFERFNNLNNEVLELKSELNNKQDCQNTNMYGEKY